MHKQEGYGWTQGEPREHRSLQNQCLQLERTLEIPILLCSYNNAMFILLVLENPLSANVVSWIMDTGSKGYPFLGSVWGAKEAGKRLPPGDFV